MVDEQAVHETLLASLGHYLPMAGQLRTQPQTIVDGLKAWAVGALGLTEHPHIPNSLLSKLGVRKERGSKFDSRRPPFPGSTRTTNVSSWSDRGNQRHRDDRSGRFERRPSFDREDSRDRDSFRRGRNFANRTA